MANVVSADRTMYNSNALSHFDVLDTAPELAFDDIAALAALVCEAPIALVSLVDDDRQWFKARSGFDAEETDLSRSVCRHVVAEAATIVIPNLTADPRTRENPLVTGEPYARFYAGAPLTTQFGVVGALCVIDVQPRPGGLSLHQQSALERLARQVVQLLEMRRAGKACAQALIDKEQLETDRAAAERRWRDLYRNMDQGFIYGRVVRDEAGRIHDWRYEEVNEAWGALVGIDPAAAEGKTIRELIPGIEDAWVMEFADVVDTHEAVRFTRQVGMLGRWYDGVAQWVGGDDFTVLFNEVTERVHEEARRDALLLLGDVLRDSDSVGEMTNRASRIIGEAVQASRATFGQMDHSREHVEVAAGWEEAGMPPIAGNYRFDDYGRIREFLIKGELVVVSDTLLDERTADDARGWQALRARAVVNVPVRERGRTAAVLIVHKDAPHIWTEGELAFLRNAADRLEIAISRQRDEEQQDVVNGEIAHRLKNALAMAQAIATQTLRGDASEDGLRAFTHRLQALGTAHDALTAGRWKAATMDSVVPGVLDAAGVRDRCLINGPPVELGARAALSLSLLVHELATNAVKYGSLSVDGGAVGIAWRLDGADEACELVMTWDEIGGPPAAEPTRKGFGSRLVRLGLVGTGGSDVRYTEAGFSATFRAPLAQVEQA